MEEEPTAARATDAVPPEEPKEEPAPIPAPSAAGAAVEAEAEPAPEPIHAPAPAPAPAPAAPDAAKDVDVNEGEDELDYGEDVGEEEVQVAPQAPLPTLDKAGNKVFNRAMAGVGDVSPEGAQVLSALCMRVFFNGSFFLGGGEKLGCLCNCVYLHNTPVIASWPAFFGASS